MSKAKSALDLFMLYASRSGAVLVGILILPQFSRMLGADQFGIVATIFSLQALLLMLDLGMATIVGRELAVADKTAKDHATVWKTARSVLVVAYTALALPTLLASLLLPFPLSTLQTGLVLVLFLSLTSQNVGLAALLAGHHFVAAGTLQLVGVSGRGALTLLAMAWFGADLTVFLLAQAVCAIAQQVATSTVCRRALEAETLDAIRVRIQDCLAMMSSGKSLMLYGLAGASVMQLDKVIVASFTSPAQMAPYYLATTLCLTPLAVLAGPIAQYFQPRVIHAITVGDGDAMHAVFRPFVSALVIVTVLPTLGLWLTRDQLIAYWLGQSPLVAEVVHFSGILLPGIALGALSYVPYVILVTRREFKFMSMASALMTIVTLLATVASASAGSVAGVCWIYAAYHAISLFVSWGRCLVLQRRDGTRYAGRSASLMIKMLALSFIPALVVSAIHHLIFKTAA